MPMNWLLPEEALEQYQRDTEHTTQPSLENINYWVARCIPLWMPGLCQVKHAGRKTVFVACNRTGVERDITFAGTSCAISFTLGDRADLMGALGTRSEGVLLVNTGTESA